MAGNKNSGRKAVSMDGTKLASLAREHTAMAIDTLVDLAMNAPENSVRKSACDSLLDRGWGKPTQAITGADGGDIKATVTVKFV